MNLKWSFSQSMMNLQQGGFVRQQVASDLPPSQDFSSAQNHLAKGAIRQMHWHSLVSFLRVGEYRKVDLISIRMNGVLSLLGLSL
jgi:hypothetical protein